MLKTMVKNEKKTFWLVVCGLFGIGGLLMVPVVKYMIEVANRHPKAFNRSIMVVLISVSVFMLMKREWNASVFAICMSAIFAINGMFKENSK